MIQERYNSMKCINCGHELPDNANFCNQCGTSIQDLNSLEDKSNSDIEEKTVVTNEKKGGWNDKYTILVMAGVLVLAAGIGVIYKTIGNKANNDFVATEEYYKETNASPSISEEKISERQSENEIEKAEEFGIDVEMEVLHISRDYKSIVQNIDEGKYLKTELRDGVTAYSDGKELKTIEVSKGVDDNSYRRFYYYADNQLIFAYYENSDAHRFYFHEGLLIRWRYTGNAAREQEEIDYDLEQTEDYYNWEENVIEVSNLLKEEYFSSLPEPFRMSYIEEVSATSALSEYNMTHNSGRVIDGDNTTAWVEGAEGQGIEETITIYFDGSYQIQGMTIYAGYQKSSDLYQKNSRPQEMKISFSDGSSTYYELKDINGAQDIILEKSVVTDFVSFTIESVYAGYKYEDTAISEIYIY